MLISLVMVIISQFLHISKQQVVYLKCIQFYLSIIPDKPGGREEAESNVG